MPAKILTPDVLARAILKVGEGRGFVVERRAVPRNFMGRIIITAAHVIANADLLNGTQGLPSCHPARHVEEETYPRLLSRLDGECSVAAACLFVDPIADIAVLGPPDNQALSEEADAYDRLVKNMEPMVVADAPAQGFELVKPEPVTIDGKTYTLDAVM
jgi:hypothetical protein